MPRLSKAQTYILLTLQIGCLVATGLLLTMLAWLSVVTLALGLLLSRFLISNQGSRELEAANQKLAAANQRLQILSTIDPLTELLNRRSFESSFLHEWRLNARRQSPLAVLMVDIDFFKQFNDNQGHLAGDACLQLVAQILRRTLRRPTDITARYGGEEFVILLSDTLPDAAHTVAESLRQAIEQAAIPHPNSTVAPVVTISIGIACCTPTMDASAMEIIDLADKALYQAKHNGRNQILDMTGCPF